MSVFQVYPQYGDADARIQVEEQPDRVLLRVLNGGRFVEVGWLKSVPGPEADSIRSLAEALLKHAERMEGKP